MLIVCCGWLICVSSCLMYVVDWLWFVWVLVTVVCLVLVLCLWLLCFVLAIACGWVWLVVWVLLDSLFNSVDCCVSYYFCVVFRLAFLYVDSDCLCYVTVLAFWFGLLFYGCVVACESTWCLIL